MVLSYRYRLLRVLMNASSAYVMQVKSHWHSKTHQLIRVAAVNDVEKTNCNNIAELCERRLRQKTRIRQTTCLSFQGVRSQKKCRQHNWHRTSVIV